MNRSTMTRALLAAATAAAFLWTLALAASPQLHERIHANANSAGHSCVVTVVASGKFDCPATGLISTPILVVEFTREQQLTSVWVQPFFLVAAVFEHAPPAIA